MKNSIVLILLLVVFATYFKATTCKNLKGLAKSDSKIVGGGNISIKDVPYQVYLRIYTDNGYITCGGSIISENYVLTSARCVDEAQDIYVLIATTVITDGGIIYNATSWVIHPDYDESIIDYDVALVYINKGIVLDGEDSKIVELAAEGMELETGNTVLVTGWGATDESSIDLPKALMAAEVPIIDHDECGETYIALTDRMFCAGFKNGGEDACQGDSGGPAVLIDTGVQVGIISFGYGCARKDYPGVYVNIANPSIRDFILTNADV